MKPGDYCEFAIWLTGEETEDQIRDFTTVRLEAVRQRTEETVGCEIGPWTIEYKRPGAERVPPVPDHIKGIDVRIMVATAKVGQRKPKPILVKQTGFVEDLTKEDRTKLRRMTRVAHARAHPGDRLTDRQCDTIIEQLGPDVAVKTLRGGQLAH